MKHCQPSNFCFIFFIISASLFNRIHSWNIHSYSGYFGKFIKTGLKDASNVNCYCCFNMSKWMYNLWWTFLVDLQTLGCWLSRDRGRVDPLLEIHKFTVATLIRKKYFRFYTPLPWNYVTKGKMAVPNQMNFQKNQTAFNPPPLIFGKLCCNFFYNGHGRI